VQQAAQSHQSAPNTAFVALGRLATKGVSAGINEASELGLGEGKEPSPVSRERNRVVVYTDGAGAAQLGSRLIVLRQPRTLLGQLQLLYDTAKATSAAAALPHPSRLF
jgi:hypothetical protein